MTFMEWQRGGISGVKLVTDSSIFLLLKQHETEEVRPGGGGDGGAGGRVGVGRWKGGNFPTTLLIMLYSCLEVEHSRLFKPQKEDLA